MKKLSAMLLALAGLFILAGCSDSPRDVTVKWAKAIVDGDVKKANEYTTEKTRPINGLMVGVLSADDENGKKAKAEFEANIDKLKKAKEEINGDEAKVTVEGESKPITLKKVDGKWKVDAQK